MAVHATLSIMQPKKQQNHLWNAVDLMLKSLPLTFFTGLISQLNERMGFETTAHSVIMSIEL
jgi:hypothetical protein